jgi:hypothetical protein
MQHQARANPTFEDAPDLPDDLNDDAGLDRIATDNAVEPEQRESSEELQALIPDLFHFWTRVLCRPDGQGPRILVRVAPRIAAAGYCCFVLLLLKVFENGRELSSADAAANFSDLEFVRQMLMFGCFLSGPMYLPFLERAIRPQTGTLALLGIGTKMVTAAQVRSLETWKKLMLIPSFVMWLWGLFMLYVGALLMLHSTGISVMTGKGAESMGAWAPLGPMAVSVLFASVTVGWPAGFAWYVALKVRFRNQLPSLTRLAVHGSNRLMNKHAARVIVLVQRTLWQIDSSSSPFPDEGGRRALAGRRARCCGLCVPSRAPR